MSLITCCPSCRTLFKVVPDQLRVSDGWVRCGQCEEIFDASRHLQESEPDAVLPSHAPLESGTAGTALVTVRERIDAEAPPELEVQQSEAHLQVDVLAPEIASQPEAAPPVPDGAPDVATDELDTTDDEPLLAWRAEASDAALPAPSFLDATAPVPVSRARRWIVNAVQVVLVVALLVALAAQVARIERDVWVQRWPATRGLLTPMCEVLRCRLGPLKNPDGLVIENSGLTRVVGDVYRLGVTLRNRSEQPLAWPDVEVTLTDAADQPVLRRVVRPQDWGMPGVTLDAQRDWQGQLTVRVRMPAGSERFVGYRLYVFYS